MCSYGKLEHSSLSMRMNDGIYGPQYVLFFVTIWFVDQLACCIR